MTRKDTSRHQKVRTARGRKISSTRWLERQLNDDYVQMARDRGYRSRAAFKLIEIDDKLGVLRNARRIVDLGAAPGGWSQICAERAPQASVLAVDILPMDSLPGVESIEMDFTENSAPQHLKDMLRGPADLVLSDMAPNTTGHKQTDHLRIIALAEMACDFALEILEPGGHFLCKVFEGGAQGAMLENLKHNFTQVKHIKPRASRKESAEIYVAGLSLKPAKAAETD